MPKRDSIRFPTIVRSVIGDNLQHACLRLPERHPRPGGIALSSYTSRADLHLQSRLQPSIRAAVQHKETPAFTSGHLGEWPITWNSTRDPWSALRMLRVAYIQSIPLSIICQQTCIAVTDRRGGRLARRSKAQDAASGWRLSHTVAPAPDSGRRSPYATLTPWTMNCWIQAMA